MMGVQQHRRGAGRPRRGAEHRGIRAVNLQQFDVLEPRTFEPRTGRLRRLSHVPSSRLIRAHGRYANELFKIRANGAECALHPRPDGAQTQLSRQAVTPPPGAPQYPPRDRTGGLQEIPEAPVTPRTIRRYQPVINGSTALMHGMGEAVNRESGLRNRMRTIHAAGLNCFPASPCGRATTADRIRPRSARNLARGLR